jgi:hypothetical protein
MNNIYNFIRLNNREKSNVIIFLTEIDEFISNKDLYDYGNYLFNYLYENKFIQKDSTVLISYIKHFSKTIKNMIISRTDDFDKKKCNINQLIIEYININKRKIKMDNYHNHINLYLI